MTEQEINYNRLLSNINFDNNNDNIILQMLNEANIGYITLLKKQIQKEQRKNKIKQIHISTIEPWLIISLILNIIFITIIIIQIINYFK